VTFCDSSVILHFSHVSPPETDIGCVHPYVGLGEVGLHLFEISASVVGWVRFSDSVTAGSNDCVLLF